jgi:hypothetical protein
LWVQKKYSKKPHPKCENSLTSAQQKHDCLQAKVLPPWDFRSLRWTVNDHSSNCTTIQQAMAHFIQTH